MQPAAILQNSTHSTPISDANLSPAQLQVAAALAQGHTVTSAARDARVHRTTIYHWLQHEPVFAAAVRTGKREYVDTLNDDLRELSARAFQTLRRLLDDPATPPAVQLKTALAVLRQPIESLDEPDGLDEGDPVVPEAESVETQSPPPPTISRCAPCPCGSGRKYKRCCALRHDTPF